MAVVEFYWITVEAMVEFHWVTVEAMKEFHWITVEAFVITNASPHIDSGQGMHLPAW